MRNDRRGSSHAGLAGISVAIVFAALAAAADAQVARIEVHPVPSITLSAKEFLTGAGSGTPVTLAGELRIPKPGTDKLPAIILIHGSGGLGGSLSPAAQWAAEFNAAGLATFALDSFSGRGLVETVTDQSRLSRVAMIVDAYRALDVLSRHSRIDPQRIAVMGFSRGGQAALYAGVERFQRLHGMGRTFAAYIAMYPTCTTEFVADDKLVARPIRILHGAADDWVPIAACRSYVERTSKAGADIQLTEFPDAHHAFDAPAAKIPIKLPHAATTRRCRITEASDGVLINAETRQPYFDEKDPCLERGTTVAYHEAATMKARSVVKEFLGKTLKLPNP